MIRTLRILSVIVIGLTALVQPVVAIEKVRIEPDEIPRYIKERNQHARGADLIREAAETGKGHLSRSYLPHLSASGGHETFQTGSHNFRNEPFASLDATINVYRGGRDTIEDSIRDTRARIATYDADQILRFEIEKARTSFWNLVTERELLGILQSTIKENKKDLRAAQERITAGIATDTDRLEFEMYQIQLEQDVARVQLAIKSYEAELSVLLGFSEGAELETIKIVTHDHADELLTTGFSSRDHPAVRALQTKSEEANLESIKAERIWRPSVELFGTHGLHTYREREYDLQGDRIESVIGARVQFDIFDGNQSSTEAAQKKIEASGLEAQHRQSAMELQAQVDTAKAQLALSHELIHKSEYALKMAKRYLEQTIDEYGKGVKNSPDMLSAREKNLEIVTRFVELRRDYQLARVQLLSLLGR